MVGGHVLKSFLYKIMVKTPEQNMITSSSWSKEHTLADVQRNLDRVREWYGEGILANNASHKETF